MRRTAIITLILSIMPWLIINLYPVGDWVSEPLINMFIIPPVLAIELLFIYLIFNNKAVKFSMTSLIILCVSSYGFLLHYIKVH